MKYSNFSEEKKLWKKGYRCVVGIDEVGRGPLAGPVVACAVCARPGLAQLNAVQLRDSKQLSLEQREELYKIFVKHPMVAWGEGRVSAKVIDRINIFQATKLAMKRAIQHLQRKLEKNQSTKTYDRRFLYFVDFLIVDGNMRLDVSIPQKSIIKGDEKVFSCAAASIIAKVRRDRLMNRYHKKYPEYGFDKHKGYGTKFHFEMLKKHGPSRIHRRSFAPVDKIIRSIIERII